MDWIDILKSMFYNIKNMVDYLKVKLDDNFRTDKNIMRSFQY